MTDPKYPDEFLSRVGYRKVKAAENANLTGPVTSVGNATTLNPLTEAIPSTWTGTTQSPGNNTTLLATTAFVTAAVAAGGGGSSTFAPTFLMMGG